MDQKNGCRIAYLDGIYVEAYVNRNLVHVFATDWPTDVSGLAADARWIFAVEGGEIEVLAVDAGGSDYSRDR